MDDGIQYVLKLVRTFQSLEYSGHDSGHSERVASLALCLQRKEGGNSKVILYAALLHDLLDYKIAKDDGSSNIAAIELVLRMLNVDVANASQVIEIVKTIGFRKNLKRRLSIEEKIVLDANMLDAMGAIGIARVFAFGGANKHQYFLIGEQCDNYASRVEYLARKKSSFTHIHEKLLKLVDELHTNTAKEMARSKHNFVNAFIAQFEAEVAEATVDLTAC
jgi:uncharacterized protein